MKNDVYYMCTYCNCIILYTLRIDLLIYNRKTIYGNASLYKTCNYCPIGFNCDILSKYKCNIISEPSKEFLNMINLLYRK